MRLRPTDIYSQLLRPVGVLGAEFRFSDVRTRHVWLFEFFDSAEATDRTYVDMTFVWKPDAVSPVDATRFEFTASLSDSIAATEFLYADMTTIYRSDATSADTVRSTFSVRLASAAGTVDRVFSSFTVNLRDSVTAGSDMSIDSDSGIGKSDSIASTDFVYSTFVAAVGDTSTTSDNVVIGIRYLIDCFFGGLSFGGSPFGGRAI